MSAMTAASTRRKRRSSSGTRSQRAQKRATSKQASEAGKSPMGATDSKAQEADALEGAQGSRAAKPPQGLHSATRAIQKELNKLRKLQSGENGASSLPAGGFEVELADEEDLYTWRIKLRPSLFAGSPLEQDLNKAARAQKVAEIPVLLEIRFPGDFPRAPPFIRVVSPRFAFHTGHVTIGGSICTQFLTASGWTPGYCWKSLTDLESADLLIDGVIA